MFSRILFSTISAATLLTAAPALAADGGTSNQQYGGGPVRPQPVVRRVVAVASSRPLTSGCAHQARVHPLGRRTLLGERRRARDCPCCAADDPRASSSEVYSCALAQMC